MDRLKYFFLKVFFFTALLLPAGSMAQAVEELNDSLVYGVAMYKDLYNSYATKKGLLQQDIISIVKEEFPDIASRVSLNAKFEALGIDVWSVLDLSASISKKLGVPIAEEEAVEFATVNDIFEAVRSEGDTIMLVMAYYPWREVFESRSVHRVSVYEDGIAILGDLIYLTHDSIQREIYLNELMSVYDMWCENVDTINSRIDKEYSKTLILSEKARKYDEMLPVLYGLKWNVGADTINSRAIQEHVFGREVSRLYDYMKEALYEQNGKDELYYEIPYLFFRLSHSRLNHLNRLGKFRTYTDQYTSDFDSVNARFELYKTLALDHRASGNISLRHKEVADMYDEASGAILVGTSKDWRKKEPEFRRQLYEKMDLWDFGLESPDPAFLNRIINGLNTDSSEVYIEAMKLYIELPPTDEKMLANVLKYRKKLAAYYMREKQYDTAMPLWRKIAADEKVPEEKAFALFNVAECQFIRKEYSKAQTNYSNAIKLNADYGDAYYKLALCYEQIKFYKDAIIDRYKFLLCIDKLNLGLESVRRNATGSMRKYNRVSESAILSRIEELKSYCPTQTEAFMLPPNYKDVGKTISFGVAGQTTIRFYNP